MADRDGVAQVLETGLEGEVLGPDDEGWDQARLAWNLTADQNPAAVVYAQSAADVAAAIRAAREHGLGVAAQGTGHGAVALGPLDEVVLLKTQRMSSIELDEDTGVARIGAGVIWRDLMNAAEPVGLAGLAGSSPDVGVVGYSLGGGLGWLGRRHGFACNSVRGFEVVTPDGETRRVDADNEPDLFWAMRGGGGSFAVVTAMTSASSRRGRSTRAASCCRPSRAARSSSATASGHPRFRTS